MSHKQTQTSASGTNPGAENIKPYSQAEGKGEQVRRMFDAIAPAYDFMNTAMTFGMHDRWRARALDMAINNVRRLNEGALPLPTAVLDVACGTGDVTFDLLHRLPQARVTGIDLSDGMLEVARRKCSDISAADLERISFQQGDCLALPFADDTFHLITVAYGVRNFERLADGIREMARVMAPGGTLCILELSVPSNPILKLGYKIYTRTLVPLAGRLASGDGSAYSYLPKSIAACAQGAEMLALMRAAGLQSCVARTLLGGVVTIYLASKTHEVLNANFSQPADEVSNTHT